ncbi:hypothetical protein [Thalassomonas viridans]|nr:hypothetical protein [Thalassomonas viridans]
MDGQEKSARAAGQVFVLRSGIKNPLAGASGFFKDFALKEGGLLI